VSFDRSMTWRVPVHLCLGRHKGGHYTSARDIGTRWGGHYWSVLGGEARISANVLIVRRVRG